eukprot:6048954-Amphidinium_carterae.1
MQASASSVLDVTNSHTREELADGETRPNTRSYYTFCAVFGLHSFGWMAKETLGIALFSYKTPQKAHRNVVAPTGGKGSLCIWHAVLRNTDVAKSERNGCQQLGWQLNEWRTIANHSSSWSFMATNPPA